MQYWWFIYKEIVIAMIQNSIYINKDYQDIPNMFVDLTAAIMADI